MGGRPVPTRPLPKRPTHPVHTFRPPRSVASRAWSFPGLGAPRAALCVGDDEGLELGACVRILGTSSTLTYIREHSIVDPVGKKMELCSTNVSNGHDDHTHKLGVGEREAGVHTPPGGPRKDRAHPRSRHHCEGDQPRQLSGKFDGQHDIVQCKEGGFQQLVTKRHHHFTTGTPHRRTATFWSWRRPQMEETVVADTKGPVFVYCPQSRARAHGTFLTNSHCKETRLEFQGASFMSIETSVNYQALKETFF
eukprot:XP_028336545.1 PRELI domain containing protein 3A isoform X2 [Physeter catodon]